MHYNDYVSESRNRGYQNGEGGEVKIKLGYRRDVIFGPQDDTVPDTFESRQGRAELRWGEVKWTWTPASSWGDKTVPAYWRITQIRVTGNKLKKDGKPGLVEVSQGYYLNLEDSDGPPDWLVKIIEDHRPDGDLHPFPEEIT